MIEKIKPTFSLLEDKFVFRGPFKKAPKVAPEVTDEQVEEAPEEEKGTLEQMGDVIWGDMVAIDFWKEVSSLDEAHKEVFGKIVTAFCRTPEFKYVNAKWESYPEEVQTALAFGTVPPPLVPISYLVQASIHLGLLEPPPMRLRAEYIAENRMDEMEETLDGVPSFVTPITVIRNMLGILATKNEYRDYAREIAREERLK